jgi:hypothetical protein
MHMPTVMLGVILPVYGASLFEYARDVIHQAHDLGGYQHLSGDQQQVLTDQLILSRQEETTGIIRRPQAQLQDV